MPVTLKSSICWQCSAISMLILANNEKLITVLKLLTNFPTKFSKANIVESKSCFSFGAFLGRSFRARVTNLSIAKYTFGKTLVQFAGEYGVGTLRHLLYFKSVSNILLCCMVRFVLNIVIFQTWRQFCEYFIDIFSMCLYLYME